ncbi:hypothetical protein [Chamaesiphon sp.]|uniref:hypothetical protein n=1 Tax=Chamaesiphon sp. TaxID=2814140 RepID=UPI003593BF4C
MSGKYHSRVFTFISKSTDRLKDSCAKGLRHIKVAVVWTGQILLYPLQLLAQAMENFPPQLPPPPRQLSLPHPASDINIEQALDLVVAAGYPIEIAASSTITCDDWSLIDESSWNPEHELTANQSHEATYHARTASQVRAKKPSIRGLSSLLSDRQLVLVTTENELLDLLTISQQQEIRRRIGLDIAIAWHQWRADRMSGNQSTPQISSDRQVLLNGETDDRWIAIDAVDSPNQTLLLQEKIQLEERDSRSPTLRDRLQKWWHNFATVPPEPSTIVPDFTLKLPATKYPFTPQPPRRDRFIELPQLPPILETQSHPTPANPVLAKLGKFQLSWLKNWSNYYRDYLHIPSQTNNQIIYQPAEFKLEPIDPQPQKIRYTELTQNQPVSLESKVKTRHQTTNQISNQVKQELEHFPDWIETDSELIGYSRSPLSHFLAWLDRIILAIENWLIKIWEMITNHPARS